MPVGVSDGSRSAGMVGASVNSPTLEFVPSQWGIAHRSKDSGAAASPEQLLMAVGGLARIIPGTMGSLLGLVSWWPPRSSLPVTERSTARRRKLKIHDYRSGAAGGRDSDRPNRSRRSQGLVDGMCY